MAKQQKPITVKPAAKGKATGDTGAFGYILRNLAIIAVISLLFFVVDRRNAKQSNLNELYQEFQQLRQVNGNPARMQELYNQIIEIQTDTAFFARTTRGYHWAIHDLALKNLENIQQVKEQLHQQRADSTEKALFEAKMHMRVGNYNFIEYIRKNTPENAVLLLPEGDSITSNTPKWNYIYDPEWMEYFVYPRLCLAIGREDEHPDLAKRITHVVIIEGKGYDKLKYNVPVEQRPDIAVFPINEPPAQLKTN